MELPFELWKSHKASKRNDWRYKGLITDEFEAIYQQYIYSTNCELCGNEYKSRRDRCMEHCHETGKFRNICCHSCNQRKRDRKIQSNNTSGYKYIYKKINSRCKQGFTWIFQLSVNRKMKDIKSSIDLEKLIKFRDEWFKDNPDYYT